MFEKVFGRPTRHSLASCRPASLVKVFAFPFFCFLLLFRNEFRGLCSVHGVW